MKKLPQDALNTKDGLSFAMDILQVERNKENHHSQRALKLDETLNELDRFSEAKLSWPLLKSIFRAWEAQHPERHLSAYVVFTSESWPKQHYTLTSRTYAISSNNKAFQPNMGGYSIFGSCLDGSDSCIRIDLNMAEEKGAADGWKVDYCILLGHR